MKEKRTFVAMVEKSEKEIVLTIREKNGNFAESTLFHFDYLKGLYHGKLDDVAIREKMTVEDIGIEGIKATIELIVHFEGKE